MRENTGESMGDTHNDVHDVGIGQSEKQQEISLA
jgi:hypothetical protein